MTTNTLGIDIGGTKISAAVINKGNILSDVAIFSTGNTAQEIFETVISIVERFQAEYELKAVGIATAGTVDIDNSKVTGSTGNLPQGYSDLDFKGIVQEKFGLDTYIENDANAAAYAEYIAGNAVGHKNTITITLGTGIGGGIIVDGKLLRGKSGVGAECGHIPLTWERKRLCSCGAWDCWEAYASGTGYAKNAREMALKFYPYEKKGILLDLDAYDLTTYDIIKGLNKGDEFCQAVHDRWEELVLLGLISLVNIFDPESIILSGGMAKFINFEKLEEGLNKRAVISQTKLLHAKAENNAGIIGAASLAAEKFC
ncbi:MAG: ROK family protein [bacterium]